MIISAEDITSAFDFPEASILYVCSHNFNEKDLWDEILNESAPEYVKFSAKKKVLLKPT